MNTINNFLPRNEKEKVLARSFLKLKNEQQVMNYLRDLLTLQEIEEFANRLEIARLLEKGESYISIATKTHVSTTTVTRVAHWLNRGCGGYKKALHK
ncbi:MAG: TrpR like protein, YerC/YecD [Candidatus Roizmanbacteria bacterium GW2011_GWA2_36_23]|uniref:TrpR like protein, YerC/YecD n=1 Tax=Candidatus Roizmanbacteria bacterium GW2011_GWA2_36_23 TaxID=1618480 RepID=A0A0G0HD85_9BACT|nr:MAG: TrpR like protein, YerC/YecD [Candidatus Roizmanbacteria bacterium GW2011_GWA2_36_23]